MTYELPELRTVLEIRSVLEDFIVNGYRPVYNEAFTYTNGINDYELSCDGQKIKKIYDILQVNGQLNGIRHTFVNGSDYTVKDSNSDGYYDQLTWDLGMDKPDNDTIFYVDYRYMGTPSKLTDISDSSVLSMILDAVSCEIRLLELKINDVARNSFIDTATGIELDELGKIAGVYRNPATQSTGYVTMSRAASMATGIVDIPVGSQVSTIGTVTQSSIIFETTASAQIMNGETTAKVSDPNHKDYGNPWIPVQSIYPGSMMNVSSNTITKNVSVNTVVTTIINPSEFDTSNEQIIGTGTLQSFILDHIVTAAGFVDKDYDNKAIEIKAEDVHGWMAQPASAGKVKITTSANWTGTATIVGYSATDGDNVSDTITFVNDGTSGKTNTNINFTYLYYISFSGPSGGLGTTTVRIQCPDTGGYVVGSSVGQAVNDRVDSGFTALHSVDNAYDKVYVYSGGLWNDDTNNWTRTSVNINGYARTHYAYTSLADWESTYGSNGTRKLRFEYVPSKTCGTSNIYQYTVDNDRLEILWPLVDGSYLEVDYRWANTFIDGANTESDNEYRERIKSGLTAFAKGTKAAILAAVLSVNGIVGATVFDYVDDPSINIGECNVFAWSAGGTLTSAKRSEIYAAIENVRPAGIKVILDSPDPIYIAVEITVKVQQNKEYTITDVKTSVENAIATWISSHTVGQSILESELISIIGDVPGVSYVDMTSLKVKGFENVTDDGTTPSTREPNTEGWSWTTGWNKIVINKGDIVRPDTDDTGSGTVRYINVTAEFE